MATSTSREDITWRIIKTYGLKIKNSYKKELRRMNYRKLGRPFRFTSTLIELSAFIREKFSLTYRDLSYFIESIIGIRISKTQLHERINRLNLDFTSLLNSLNNKELILIVDSTGFKPSNRGEWRIIKHEKGIIKKRNGYVKVSAIVGKD